jgi:hypothetical protein
MGSVPVGIRIEGALLSRHRSHRVLSGKHRSRPNSVSASGTLQSSYDVLSTPNQFAPLDADQREAEASRKKSIRVCPLSLVTGKSSKRPGAVKGARVFARRSGPLTARTVLEHQREEKGDSPIRFGIPPLGVRNYAAVPISGCVLYPHGW